MNSIKKFKKWLIHKLGGLCKDDISILPPVMTISKEKQIERIHAEYTTVLENVPKEIVKQILLDGIYKELSKYYFEIEKQQLDKYDVYSMELEFILQ